MDNEIDENDDKDGHKCYCHLTFDPDPRIRMESVDVDSGQDSTCNDKIRLWSHCPLQCTFEPQIVRLMLGVPHKGRRQNS